MQWFVNANARVEYKITKSVKDKWATFFNCHTNNKFWEKKRIKFIEFVFKKENKNYSITTPDVLITDI